MTRVFVYGSLKAGHWNNRLLNGARLVGEATTVGEFVLLDAGYPIAMPASGYRLQGEVWEFSSRETLARLDALEGEGRMYFRRRRKVKMADGSIARVNMYIGHPRFWRSHRVGARWINGNALFNWSDK